VRPHQKNWGRTSLLLPQCAENPCYATGNNRLLRLLYRHRNVLGRKRSVNRSNLLLSIQRSWLPRTYFFNHYIVLFLNEFASTVQMRIKFNFWLYFHSLSFTTGHFYLWVVCKNIYVYIPVMSCFFPVNFSSVFCDRVIFLWGYT